VKRIPSSFELMGHKITVEIIPTKDWPHGECVGLYQPDKGRISILRQSKTQNAHVFWHEATHAMLYVMGHKLYSNEGFVDTLGGLIAQINSTAE
jgi:hypothetical protein